MIDSKGQSIGLVEVNKPENIDLPKYSADEIIAIENAYNYGAQYIYFRRFKNRPPIPQVYIYDLTTAEVINNDVLVKLHQRLYSSGHVPMFFVFSKTEVRIFNCYDRPAKNNKLIYKPLTIIKLAAKISDLFDATDEKDIEKFKAFSGRSFDNGSFWENSPFSKEFQFANSAYERLLTELKQALNDIINKNILPSFVARKIMVISILIKYLEERSDENQNTIFPKEGEKRISIVNGRRQKVDFDKSFFDTFSKGATCFTDVLKKKGAGLKLLEYLADHFNGGVFKLTAKEKTALKDTDLTRFALFLEGNLEGVQFVFWRLYSFNDLPVELISNIYEEFLGKKPGVVYTPPYLVNFLLDEAMPLEADEINFKVLDPACGSGVFLVGAYRRLIYRWRRMNNWKRPKLLTLKKLLRENIHGSDKDPEAVNLTIFSLSLALCDELTPLEIWENLEFDDLTEENIFTGDFFSLILECKFIKNSFDLVIGNPPFEAKLTDAAKKVDAEAIKERRLQLIESKVSKGVKLPDNQIALLFLEQAIGLCKPGKLVSLIQPSGPFLYNNSAFHFRQYLLQQYCIPQIIDFTHLSRVLFGKNGDVPTVAVFIVNEPPKDKGVWHITIRRTKPNKEKIYFELDSYDFQYVPRHIALSDPLIWKCNFLGGSRVHQLITRFSSFKKIGEYLSGKVKENGWAVGEGYIIGSEQEIEEMQQLINKKAKTADELIMLELLRKKYKKASYITNQDTLPSEAFSTKGIDQSKIFKQSQQYFIAPRKGDIYKAPHILIKEIIEEDNIPIAYSEDYLAFKHRIIGIHAPESDSRDLMSLYKQVRNSKAHLFYLAGTSAEFMVSRSSSFLKKDFDNLPFISKREGNFTELDKILIDDFWNYFIPFRRNGETSEIAIEDVAEGQLLNFGRIYCEVLNTVYSSLKAYKPFQTDSYICYPFYFKDKPTIEFDDKMKAEKAIEKLVKKNIGVSLRITRVVRLYDGNVIYLIKPKKLRYWLQSIALRDADETFADLRKQGF